MTLAIFDLDETLIDIDSDHEWGEFIVDRGLVDQEYHRTTNNAFYEDYKRGELDVDAYLKFACSVLTRFDMPTLHKLRQEFVEERILDHLLPAAIAVIQDHRERGHQLLIITSTIEFITRPIADAFGIETLIAPLPEIVNNRYTGKIKGVPSFGAGKVTCLQDWLASSTETMEGSYFYSDSRNDLPLLQQVDHPVAVDPDSTLAQFARDRAWPIISLR